MNYERRAELIMSALTSSHVLAWCYLSTSSEGSNKCCGADVVNLFGAKIWDLSPATDVNETKQ